MKFKWVRVVSIVNVSRTDPETPHNLVSAMVEESFPGDGGILICRGELPLFAIPVNNWWKAHAWAFEGDDERRIQKMHEEAK